MLGLSVVVLHIQALNAVDQSGTEARQSLWKIYSRLVAHVPDTLGCPGRVAIPVFTDKNAFACLHLYCEAA